MNHIVALSLSPLLLLVTASALLSPTSSVSAPAYAFAQQFTPEDLLSNQTSRDTFISLMFTYEGRFHTDGVGVDIASGMTFDGTAIHPDTLLPQVIHTLLSASCYPYSLYYHHATPYTIILLLLTLSCSLVGATISALPAKKRCISAYSPVQ
jgi:hypothetical protein